MHEQNPIVPADFDAFADVPVSELNDYDGFMPPLDFDDSMVPPADEIFDN